MNDETLRLLTQEHQLERRREAELERLALEIRTARARRSAGRSYAPLLGHRTAIRRHATQ